MEPRPLNTKIVYVNHLPEYCPVMTLLDVRTVYNYEKEYRNNSVLILISHKKSNVYNDLKSE